MAAFATVATVVHGNGNMNHGGAGMKAAVIEKQGGVENISYRDWPDPEARPGDVVVWVRACGLNHLDIFVRRGMPGFPVPMPFISGGDIAGEIAVVGEGVTGWSVGDRVVLNPGTSEGMIGEQLIGGLAELVRVPADYLVRLPDTLSFDVGAAIPINYGTAHRMLFHRGRLQAGETVLVLGASGGVGSPAGATRAEQIRVPENVLRTQGLGAWPKCGPRGATPAVFSTPAAQTPAPAAVGCQAIRGGAVLGLFDFRKMCQAMQTAVTACQPR